MHAKGIPGGAARAQGILPLSRFPGPTVVGLPTSIIGMQGVHEGLPIAFQQSSLLETAPSPLPG